MSRAVRRKSSLALVAVAMWAGSTGAPAADWLSLGSKHWAPTVTSKTGIGTANAAAEAKVTREEITGWCANWSPGDADCAKRELASAEAKKTYRATADCTRGRLTAVDGNTYTLAGMWDNSDIGGGRSKWRDASGKIVGRDNASGGLGISQQWEVLCPGPIEGAPVGATTASPPPGKKAAPAAQFAVGQTVEAKYGRDWVRGRIDRVLQVAGTSGPQTEYDVRLVNGQRGILPERMVRRVPGE
jgi:hypothetical protein